MTGRFGLKVVLGFVLGIFPFFLGALVQASSPWAVLDALSDQNTIDSIVSNQKFRSDFSEFRRDNPARQGTIRFGEESVYLVNPGRPSGVDPLMDSAVEAISEAEFQRVKESRMLDARGYGDAAYSPEPFCYQQAVCLSAEVRGALESVVDESFQVWVRGGWGTGFRMVVGSGDEKRESLGLFHVGVVVKKNDSWGVIDPIIFHDNKIHSLGEWYDRFARIEPIEFQINAPIDYFH